MPISSNYIAQTVGGQQVAFANTASYAQQISGTYGMGGQQPGMMSAPNFPSYGGGGEYNEMAGAAGMGGAAMSMPAGVSAATMMAGFAKGPLSWMDPFTGVARGFAGGAGAGGMGVGGTLGKIGQAFTQGGLGGGMGAIGGGLAGAAMMAAPYAIAGGLIQKTATSAYEGMQNIADVNRLTQGMGPFYGAGGMSRPGGGMARGQIEDITKTLEQVASEDTLRSVQSMKNLVGKFTQMGMMTGVMDANTFQSRFKQLTEQVTVVAKMLGTSLEEAAPLMRNMQQMGLWKPQDIFGAVSAMNMVGRNAQPQLMGAMQAGAQTSWQAGGNLAAGANLGRNQFLRVQSMMRTGSMTEEELMNQTGGVGGVEGQRMLAEQQTQTISKFAQAPMGRLMMAGLGEYKEGAFTGKIDKGAMQRFMSGGVSIGQLERTGRGRTGSREGAASYTLRSEELGQEMMSQGGDTAIATAMQSMMGRAGYGGAKEGIQGIFLQRVMGVSAREAQRWTKMIKDLPRLQEDQTRRAMDAIDDQFRRLDERMNRSWDGFEGAVKHEWEEMWRPVRETAGSLLTGYQQGADKVTDWFYGRQRQMRLSQTERLRLLADGAGVAGGGGGGARLNLQGSAIENMRMGGTRGQNLMAAGVSFDMVQAGSAMGPGQQSLGVVGGAERGGTYGGMGMAPPGMGGGSKMMEARVNSEVAMAEAGRIVNRANDASLAGLGFTGENDQDNLNVVKQALSNISNSKEGRAALAQAKKSRGKSHGQYIGDVVDILKAQGGPQAAKAIEALVRSKGGDARLRSATEKDILAAAVDDGAIVPGDLALDFKGAAGKIQEAGSLPFSLMGDEEFAKAEKTSIDQMKDAFRGSEGWMGTLAKVESYAAAGAVAPIAGLISGINRVMTLESSGQGGIMKEGAAFLGAFGEAAGGVFSATQRKLTGMSDTDLEDALQNGEWGLDMVRYIEGGASTADMDNKFLKAASQKGGDPRAAAMLKKIHDMRDKGQLGDLKSRAAERHGQFGDKARRDATKLNRDFASRALEGLKGRTAADAGMGAPAFERYQKILTSMAGGADTGAAIEALGRDKGVSEQDLRSMGAVGQLAASQRMVQGLGQKDMTVAQAQEFQKKLAATAGQDLIKGLGLEGDITSGKTLSLKEQRDWQKQIGGVLKRGGVGATGAGKQEEVDIKKAYIDANSKFVTAVGVALGSMMGKEQKQEVDKTITDLEKAKQDGGTKTEK